MSFAKKDEKNKKDDKKQKEKEQVHQQFEGQDLNTVKRDYDTKLQESIIELQESLKAVKSGRASTDIFDDIEVTAYGEKHPFSDLCQTIVKGNNNMLVRVFDENVKDDVIKALTRSELDLNCTLEGKDIKVKLGTTKKETIDAAIKQIKSCGDDFKLALKDIRHEMMQTVKKLEKILPQEEIKVFQKDLEKLCTNKEADAKKHIDAKEKEIKAQ
ncbi:ribosome recycling factor [Stylonychia lemnae]|uniref:Ribosome recycling factor n=1 Tax=Stylonychia lemnae TaxID=5949 RepID=A0A078AT82_STYLE|nr:ribosome recycling factor [Stylonychia lemnae]|eukprot:CDW84088.1 ribosome recycling factor [Stylonychia lemnae]